MATATRPVRVHETMLRQVEGMSRLLGQPPAALLEHAWRHYRESEEFAEMFRLAQQAFATEDLDDLVERLDQTADAWAERAAARFRNDEV